MDNRVVFVTLLMFCVNPSLPSTETSDQSDHICPDEQACTRFAYEYQLMQKLIKLELKEAELENRIQNLENSENQEASTQSVQFNAGISKALTVNIGDRLVFDSIISNIGDAYSPVHGSFTAPVNGIYLFSVTICGHNGVALAASMYHGDNKIGEVRVGDPEWKDCASDTSTTYMVTGSQVFVKITYGGSVITDQHWSTFTGVLVQRANPS